MRTYIFEQLLYRPPNYCWMTTYIAQQFMYQKVYVQAPNYCWMTTYIVQQFMYRPCNYCWMTTYLLPNSLWKTPQILLDDNLSCLVVYVQTLTYTVGGRQSICLIIYVSNLLSYYDLLLPNNLCTGSKNCIRVTIFFCLIIYVHGPRNYCWMTTYIV